MSEKSQIVKENRITRFADPCHKRSTIQEKTTLNVTQLRLLYIRTVCQCQSPENSSELEIETSGVC